MGSERYFVGGGEEEAKKQKGPWTGGKSEMAEDGAENLEITAQSTKVLGQSISVADFKVIRSLGAGAYAKVYLVKKKDTEQLFAMKAIRKDKLLVDDSILKCTILEKKILSEANHPFLVGTEFVF